MLNSKIVVERLKKKNKEKIDAAAGEYQAAVAELELIESTLKMKQRQVTAFNDEAQHLKFGGRPSGMQPWPLFYPREIPSDGPVVHLAVTVCSLCAFPFPNFDIIVANCKHLYHPWCALIVFGKGRGTACVERMCQGFVDPNWHTSFGWGIPSEELQQRATQFDLDGEALRLMHDREKSVLQKEEALDGQSEPNRRCGGSSRAVRQEMPAPTTHVARGTAGAPHEVLELGEGNEDPKTVEKVVSPMSLASPEPPTLPSAQVAPRVLTLPKAAGAPQLGTFATPAALPQLPTLPRPVSVATEPRDSQRAPIFSNYAGLWKGIPKQDSSDKDTASSKRDDGDGSDSEVNSDDEGGESPLSEPLVTPLQEPLSVGVLCTSPKESRNIVGGNPNPSLPTDNQETVKLVLSLAEEAEKEIERSNEAIGLVDGGSNGPVLNEIEQGCNDGEPAVLAPEKGPDVELALVPACVLAEEDKQGPAIPIEQPTSGEGEHDIQPPVMEIEGGSPQPMEIEQAPQPRKPRLRASRGPEEARDARPNAPKKQKMKSLAEELEVGPAAAKRSSKPITWFDESDITRGLEPIPVPVDVHVEGSRPMDCSMDMAACSCIQKNGGDCAYGADGLLQGIDGSEVSKVCEYKYCEPGEGCYVDEQTKSWDPQDGLVVCGGHVPRKFIFECNITCACRANCRNRLVQKGLSLNLNVFWTDGKGWGLKTLDAIQKGQFVVEYCGEICTNAEAMRRAAVYARCSNYTLSLDVDYRAKAASNDETALSIDGLLYGNVSRFLNHRCEDANLVDMPAKVDHSDPRLYRVAFFAIRNIEPYEELTWDYGTSFVDVDNNTEACLCGSLNCRYPPRQGLQSR